MFEEAEVACNVESFNKLNHNRHFSLWQKETDPDYLTAESLFRKLKEADFYRR